MPPTQILRRDDDEFVRRGSRAPRFAAPNFAVRLLAWCGDSGADAIAGTLGRELHYDTSATTSQLGVRFTTPEEAVVEAARDLLDKGLVKGCK